MIPSEEDDFLKEIIDPKLDMNSVEFNAAAYLAAKHADTKYSALLAELEKLKRSTTDKTEQLKALVASHFDQYLSCHEAIREVAEEIRTHESDSERLMNAFHSLKSTTDSTLSKMLKRCEEQRKIRHALAVLTRYRSLFEIPTRMRENMTNKQYTKLVENYLHVKSNANKVNMAIIKPVLDAAQKLAVEANEYLLKVLEDPISQHHEQKEAIHLVDKIGITPKSILLCINRQLADVEKVLTELNGTLKTTESAKSLSRTLSSNKSKERMVPSVSVARSSSEIIFECGQIILRFERGLWSLICDAMMLSSLTAKEQEDIHTASSDILSICVRLLREQTLYSANISRDTIDSLHDIFINLDSLRQCPDSVLNTKLDALKGSFCGQVRADVLLAFLSSTTKCSENKWAECAENEQVTWNSSIEELIQVHLTSSLRLDLAPILSQMANKFVVVLQEWWTTVEPVFLREIDANTSPSEEAHVQFTKSLFQAVLAHSQDLIRLFWQLLYHHIDSKADDAESYVHLVILANCQFLQMQPFFTQWADQLVQCASLTQTKLSTESLIKSLCASMEEGVNHYAKSRLQMLNTVLCSEESFLVEPQELDDQNGFYGELRQYVFHILQLIVKWRSQVEYCLDPSHPTCIHFIEILLGQVSDTLLHHYEGRMDQLTTQSSKEATWQLTHIQVEATFFRKALTAFIPPTTQKPWDSLIKKGEPKIKRQIVDDLVAQVEVQTQMYRLCLLK
ncbi:hypothetical protein THRCLA_11362 [Thraustotheca clavata]|uniref:Exocyst complex component n=1 Tax=Thraustotheca clavata TaxID=74557 RepID=A0A1V9Y813_9STRA|nr:hypothetical protein THRCLA_11362 [Thraustotheca clavata]